MGVGDSVPQGAPQPFQAYLSILSFQQLYPRQAPKEEACSSGLSSSFERGSFFFFCGKGDQVMKNCGFEGSHLPGFMNELCTSSLTMKLVPL